jgi:hypothetical protein
MPGSTFLKNAAHLQRRPIRFMAGSSTFTLVMESTDAVNCQSRYEKS